MKSAKTADPDSTRAVEYKLKSYNPYKMEGTEKTIYAILTGFCLTSLFLVFWAVTHC